MKPIALTFLALALASCSSGPIVMRPDGTRIVMSPSVLEKSTDESAVVRFPDGMEIAYQKKGKDQTRVAAIAIQTWGTVQGIIETAKGLNDGEAIRENNMTARQVSSDSVKKAETAADVTKATFVPPEP